MPIRHNGARTITDDDIIRRIENFIFDAGPVAMERRNRGFTLIHAESGVLIARLRPTPRNARVRIAEDEFIAVETDDHERMFFRQLANVDWSLELNGTFDCVPIPAPLMTRA